MRSAFRGFRWLGWLAIGPLTGCNAIVGFGDLPAPTYCQQLEICCPGKTGMQRDKCETTADAGAQTSCLSALITSALESSCKDPQVYDAGRSVCVVPYDECTSDTCCPGSRCTARDAQAATCVPTPAK
jgi:hypothetical protein